MWRSVPQIPVLCTRISTSLMPQVGSGTSCSHRPGSDFALTSAFIARLVSRAVLYTRVISRIPTAASGLPEDVAVAVARDGNRLFPEPASQFHPAHGTQRRANPIET